MAIEITISNNQRMVTVNLAKVRKMADSLAGCVVTNLRSRPPKHISPSALRKIDDCGALSIHLVSNRKIRQLNKQWREKDYATDVLSFPLVFDTEQPMPQSAITVPGMALELGEVIISLEKAQEQASDFGHSFERELAFLLVHGTLHILGFDHITKAQEKDMFGRQTEVLTAAGFTRKS